MDFRLGPLGLECADVDADAAGYGVGGVVHGGGILRRVGLVP